MHLAEELIVAGLTGQPGPTVPGEYFAFIVGDPVLPQRVALVAHGPAPALTLLRGVQRSSTGLFPPRSGSDNEYDPETWRGYEELPDEVRASDRRDIINFWLNQREGEHLIFQDSEADWKQVVRWVQDSLPGARFLFLWGRRDQDQECFEGYGLFAIPKRDPRPPLAAEEIALLRGVAQHPDDDSIRLVYADWLEDNGQPERAEFIRLALGPPQENRGLRAYVLSAEHPCAWMDDLPEHPSFTWYGGERGFNNGVAIWDLQAFAREADAIFEAAPLQELTSFDNRAARAIPDLLALPQLRRLKKLTLSKCPLSPAATEALARSPYLDGLTELEMNTCRLTPECLDALGAARSMPRLRTLSLWDNNINPEGTRGLVNGPLAASLHSLDLTFNRIGTAGAVALAQSPQLSALRQLHLSYGALGPQGARALAESTNLPELTELWLSRCGVGDEGAQAVAQSTQLQNLVSLSLAENGVTSDGVLALARATGLPKLSRVWLEEKNAAFNAEARAALAARFAEVNGSTGR
jgi:uncharacterized protein (TIGR02996 family)